MKNKDKEVINFKWQIIEQSKIGWTERAKVPGGWIVKSYDDTYGRCSGMTFSMVFVPDSNHSWECAWLEVR